MESKEKILFNHKGKEFIIRKSVSEYLIDEPCGGGKSINYNVEEGIPFSYFRHFSDDSYINLNFLNQIEKSISNENEIIVLEYEYNYIWELGFKDYIFYIVLKDFQNKILKYSFSEFENKLRKFSPKL